VTDTVTGLIWLKNANCFSIKNYSAANQAAAGLATGQCGLTDGSSAGEWRLPTKAEWEATIARAVAFQCNFPGVPRLQRTYPSLMNDPGIDCFNFGPTSFTGVQSGNYWSSSADDGTPNTASYVDLMVGYVMSKSKENFINWYVWPVRGGH
jgi:hypothetical protein